MGTRSRLVDATQELLWERGYAAMSPKDILSRADAGQGSMYHHFSGKQDLAVAALEASAAAMRADADALLHSEATATDRLVAYLERQRDSLRGCRMGRMTYDADVLATPELLKPISETLAWLVETIASVISEGIDTGEFPPKTDAHQLAATVVSTVQGGYVLARAQQDPAQFDAAVHGDHGLEFKAYLIRKKAKGAPRTPTPPSTCGATSTGCASSAGVSPDTRPSCATSPATRSGTGPSTSSSQAPPTTPRPGRRVVPRHALGRRTQART